MTKQNTSLRPTVISTELNKYGYMTETFTVDITLQGETRTVTFDRWMTESGRGHACAVSRADAIAISKGWGNKVWPELALLWQNADGTFKLATNYVRLNRNGYGIVGWFSTIAPTQQEAVVSRHVGA